jgi:type II secretory pathway component PulC
MKSAIIALALLSSITALASDPAPAKKTSARAKSGQPEFLLEPYLENGEMKGYSLTRFRPGSIVLKLGLREGDVIQRINGERVETSEQAVDFYNMIRESSAAEVKVQILRQKKKKTLVLNLVAKE